jgi:hypothetical protein
MRFSGDGRRQASLVIVVVHGVFLWIRCGPHWAVARLARTLLLVGAVVAGGSVGIDFACATTL